MHLWVHAFMHSYRFTCKHTVTYIHRYIDSSIHSFKDTRVQTIKHFPCLSRNRITFLRLPSSGKQCADLSIVVTRVGVSEFHDSRRRGLNKAVRKQEYSVAAM